jgi:hypothetical protein
MIEDDRFVLGRRLHLSHHDMNAIRVGNECWGSNQAYAHYHQGNDAHSDSNPEPATTHGALPHSGEYTIRQEK